MTKIQIVKLSLITAAVLIISGTAYGSWKITNDIDQITTETSKLSIPSKPSSNTAVSAPEESLETLEPENPSNWKTYRNEEYGFEVIMPNYWPEFNVRERFVKGSTVLIKFGFLTNDPTWSTEDKG